MQSNLIIQKHIFWLILIVLSLGSCNSPNENETEVDSLDQVVLIIDKCPNYSQYQNPNTGVWSSRADDFEITAINSDLSKLSYKTNQVPSIDTVVFETKGDVLELDHIYKFHRYVSFRVQKGDTVLFTYENDFPEATILNREVHDKDINYEKIRNEFVLEGEDFDGNSKFNMHPLSSIKGYIKIRDRQKSKEIRLEAYKSALEESKYELSKELLLLDSLLEKGEISKETMSYYKTRSYVLYEFNKHTYSEYLSKNFEDKEASLNKWNFQEAQDLELAGYGYYSRILDRVIRDEYYESVNWIQEVNIRFPDYRQLYDLISDNEFLSSRDTDILLAKNMKLIIEHFSEEDIESYLKNFIDDVENVDLVQGIIDEHKDAFSPYLKKWINEELAFGIIPRSSFELQLIDIQNNSLDFNQILEQNKGRLIYIDFWASHCVPCFVAMPFSKELKKDYHDQEITFIYVSIDKEYDNWVRGLKKAGITDDPFSFMVKEGEGTNTFLEKLKVNEIPRYMLFNKNGELIQYRAFGPSTPELRELLDRTL